MSERDFLRKKNKWLAKIKQWVDENDPGAAVIPCSVVFEQQVRSFCYFYVVVTNFVSVSSYVSRRKRSVLQREENPVHAT